MAEAPPRAAPQSSRGNAAQRLLDVLGAVAASLLAFTAVPLVLVVVVGNPLSGGLAHAWQAQSRDALFVVALAAWVAWAACCAQLVRGVAAHVRSGERRGHGASVLDHVAARIAIGVLALSSVGGSVALSASAGASAPAAEASALVSHHAAAALSAPAPAPAPTPAAAAAHDQRRSPEDVATTAYTVRAGDTLWRIADDHLGDGADWTALAALNLGHSMGGGERFVDPDHLEPGWRLSMPAGSRSSDPRRTGSRRPASPDRLPELVALGLGSIACAGLARRARRRRRPEPFDGQLLLPGAETDGAIDAAVLARRFEHVPALGAFETANYMLAAALADERTVPDVRAVHVGPRGVTFWFTGVHPSAPEGFDVVESGSGWSVGHDRIDASEWRPENPQLPVVLPVGDDDDGTWLVALGPRHVLTLLGADAPALARSVRSAAVAWAWSDTIVCTDDPGDPVLAAEASADTRLARPLLFFGDPTALPPEVAARAAVVTTAPGAASDLTIVVDHHGATIHPLGRVVRPHLQSEEAARDVANLLAPAAPVRPPTARTAALPRTAPPSGTAAVEPGQVDVRLLTMTPRLDGLAEPLPANRARRAVELVAYLALHQPDVITSDRLRTRVLGSSDADAASKTLFNTAHAARRAMGIDAHGVTLFPAATRAGLYALSPEVTVDVSRATALAEEGTVQDDPLAAIAHYRAALELVEGEPLANALAGYTWWEAEGHGARVAAVLVDAACAMSSLGADAGLFDLAHWGLEQARLVEPYSEALSRAAMELAAAEGDADRLRNEWRDCQRRLDALDPGSSPSPQTESLYGELIRSLTGTTRGAGVVVPRLGPQPARYASAASDGAPSAAP